MQKIKLSETFSDITHQTFREGTSMRNGVSSSHRSPLGRVPAVAGWIVLAAALAAPPSLATQVQQVALCEGPTGCQAADVRYQGAVSTDFGFASAAGDINGDTEMDLVVGAPGENAVYIYFGMRQVDTAYSLDQTSADRGVVADAAAAGSFVILEGPSLASEFGFSVAVAGSRILIGAPATQGTNAVGRTYLVPAAALTGLTGRNEISALIGPAANQVKEIVGNAGDQFGYSVALGPVATSTSTDLVIGARNAGTVTGDGAVYVLPEGVTLLSDPGVRSVRGPANAGLGEYLALGQFLNDDAVLELAIGAVGVDHGFCDDAPALTCSENADCATGGCNTGRVYVVPYASIPAGSPLTLNGTGAQAGVACVEGVTAEGLFGFSLAGGNFVNLAGDTGAPDDELAVGSIYADRKTCDNAPTTTCSVDSDCGAGLCRTFSRAGAVYVYSRGQLVVGGACADAAGVANLQTLYGRANWDQLGFAATAGDVNGDGNEDLLVSARLHDRNLVLDEIDEGAVYVIHGGDANFTGWPRVTDCATAGCATLPAQIDGMLMGGDYGTSTDSIGFSLAAGDFNGDGFADIVAGSLNNDRLYLATLEDDAEDADGFRNIRDEDDDGDAVDDDVDGDPLDGTRCAADVDGDFCDDCTSGTNDPANDGVDGDADGYCSNPNLGTPPSNLTDCDDTDANSFLGAPELCDGNDNDCDGVVPPDEVDNDTDNYVECVGWDDTQGNQTFIQNDGTVVDCDDAQSQTFPGAAPNDGPGCLRDVDDDDFGATNPPLGVTGGTDCDDTDAAINESAIEGVADGVDQDCDTQELCYEDLDGDGFGSSNTVVSPNLSCADAGESALMTDCDDGVTGAATFPGAAPNDNPGACMKDSDGDDWGDSTPAVGGVAAGTDCDDTDAAVNPGAVEGAGDGVDQDCDTQELCYENLDGDGFGSANTVVSPNVSCANPGEADNSNDCDDVSPSGGATFPGAAPNDNPGACMKDSDGDDWGDSAPAVGGVAPGTDCADGDAGINPGAVEGVADGIDQDCDTQETCYEDLDGDTYGTTNTVVSADLSCLDAGEADNTADCNDADGTINPGAVEGVADGVDQDCDTQEVCYEDLDGDTYGTTNTVVSADLSCLDAGEADNTADCNDADGTVNPGAVEGVADGVDQDCDTQETCYEDLDGDTYGTTNPVVSADLSCLDAGEADNSTDCNDADATINPGATEIPGDGIDQDCDTLDACFEDLDGDTYGSTNTVVSPNMSCLDAGEADNSTDCNDADGTINPGAVEGVADGVDQDCDTQETCYEDLDGDTYGTTNTVVSADLSCLDAGEADNTADCNDADGTVNPGAVEGVADGVDQDCDTQETCYEDLDGDTYGTTNTVVSADLSCLDAGEADNSTDCNDADATINPGATEIPGDGIDQDCDTLDACFEDLDGDTYGSTNTVVSPNMSCLDAGEADNSTDCNDADGTINPGAVEGVADGVDQDCDTQETCYEDLDGDTYGTTNTVVSADLSCLDAGEADNTADCNDADGTVNPGAVEGVADGVDQDCDTQETCYEDLDGDTYGTTNTVVSADLSCLDAGEADNSTDCNDADGTVNPGAVEGVADGVDQDCDTQEVCYEDLDGDTYGTTNTVLSADLSCLDAGESDNSTDCDDTNALIFPGMGCPSPTVEAPEAVSVNGEMVEWTPVTGAVLYHLYRGDLTALRSGGGYAQGSGGGAAQFCMLPATDQPDPFVPLPGEVAFYLVTADDGSSESGLGTDSAGQPRPNDSSCR